MRALVTGGAGFIGSHIVELLVERADSVAVIDNFATGRIENLEALANRVEIHRLDLARDDVAPVLENGRFDVVIHAAGNASIPASVADPRRDLEDNVLTTQNLLESVRRVSPGSFVVNLSSATVYAEGSDDPMPEDYPREPVSPYGVSKLAAELYTTVYSRVYGLRTASVRIFSVFGPRLRKQVVWDFMSRLASNPLELVIQGDGSERRDPSHVRNVAQAVLLVAERSPMTGDVYNLGSRDSISIDQLARDIASAMGVDPIIRHSGKRGAGHPRTWRADTRRIESLGYEQEVSYKDGLAQTVAWFKLLEHPLGSGPHEAIVPSLQ